jgi:hypothetical protein
MPERLDLVRSWRGLAKWRDLNAEMSVTALMQLKRCTKTAFEVR